MKIIITPSLLVVADYDGDELVVPLFPHEYQVLISIGIGSSFGNYCDTLTFGTQTETNRNLVKYVNTVIRTAYKDVRRTLPR